MSRRVGELELIAGVRSRWSAARAPGVVLGIGDDCALLRAPSGHELALTTDLLLEGRHFRRDWHPPGSIGHRALARGLSDLAAMGARPVAAFLSLALPPQQLTTRAGRAWVDAFFAGLNLLADRSGVVLAGGDTAASPCDLVLADIVLTGSVPTGEALRRNGARPGDLLYVTGALGGAAAELERLAAQPRRSPKKAAQNSAAHPQLYPEPRLAVGRALLRRGLAHAAIDLSDGLSTDLAHLCVESGVGAEIDAAALPIHPLARDSGRSTPDASRALDLALNGGEDYELLFAARPQTSLPRTLAGTPITRIGRIVPGSAISLLAPGGARRRLRARGWQHLTGQ